MMEMITNEVHTWMRSSVSRSTAAVASSRTRIFVFPTREYIEVIVFSLFEKIITKNYSALKIKDEKYVDVESHKTYIYLGSWDKLQIDTEIPNNFSSRILC